MSSGDSRKDFILSAIVDFFQLQSKQYLLSSLFSSESLNNFLDDKNCFILSAQIGTTKEEIEIILQNKVDSEKNQNRILIFVKVYPNVITPDNLYSDIFISSISDSPITALYHTVKKVFAPVLLRNERWSEIFNPKLQNLLCDLEAGLGTVVRQTDPNVKVHQNKSLSEIQTPLDEFKYWADKSINGKSDSEKQRASYFYEIFNQLENGFSNLNSLSLVECKDFFDIVFTVLDDIWKQEEYSPPYPQDRMEHLLDIIGNAVAIHIQKKLSHLGLWEQSFSVIEDYLHQAIDLCETWQDICQKLTTIFWPNFRNHPWKKSAFIPKYIVKFSERLLQILDLRAVHYQLTKLLSLEEQNELQMNKVFLVFKDLNPLQYNSYTDQIWKSAIKRYEDELFPAEKRVANKLRMQLQTTQNNVLQLIQQFKRYEELIKRPGIQNELTPEREMLLGQLLEYIANVRQEFSNCIKGNNENLPQLTNMPEIINSIVWVRQLEKKLTDIRKIAQVLLKDLSSYQNFSKELEEVMGEFHEYHKEQFGNWCREIQLGIKEKSLGLDINQPVISLDKEGQPYVNYSPRLVSLMREVRQLRVLGYNIPSQIQDLDDKAKIYYSQAKDLQQIVNFYKTIADHMILSQQPMMLEAARAFTRLVNEKNSISWDNPNSLNIYISKLQGAVERLSRENRMLRKFHYNVCEMVLSLMNTDLLRQQQHWKDVLNNIRGIMARLQEQGFSAENMRSWKAHWDRQLYKTLEHQYQLGIETLNESLSEIKVDVIYRNCMLQFRPPIEEIRAKYYSQMKKFLSIPVVFKGVNDFTENLIFPIIIERNSQQFINIYKKAEELFKNLESIRNKLKDWVVLGSLNIEDFVDNHCHSPEDWKRSFKVIKAKSQEFSKLQLEDEKLDCISISYAPIKAYVDYLLSELDVVMVRSLRRSVQKDCQVLQEFLTEAIAKLTYNPQSVEELAEANKKQLEYHQKKEHFLQLYEDVQIKNEFLGKWSRSAVIELSSLQGQWDMFERIIDDHSELITQQIEVLKTKVLNDLKNYEKEIERFSAHWHQLKPQNEAFNGGINQVEMAITVIKEKRIEFNELIKTKEKLLNDIEQFNVPAPDLSVIEELEKDLQNTEQIWFLFDEFKSGMDELSKEEWILFRNKVHHFELFLNNWVEKIEKQEITDEPKTITVLLHQEINNYKKVIPALKYCRGDVFSSSHWANLFHILNMPNTPIEKLLFGDFLMAKDKIIDNIENLKELNNRAQGEVTIREALNELDLWSARAKFSITEHEDSQKKKIILIKDWRDILNKVGENQCLIQSLKDSSYYKHFADRASIWENRLTTLDLSLQQLNQVQRKWVYLEPILGRGALPSEHTRFQNICNDFRSIMDNVAQDLHVISLTNYSGLSSKLNNLIDQLHRCQKALNQFLEDKRSIFPRFYFIGDEDLLEILGQATQPRIIQSHLKKLFAGIHSVEFDEECSHIISIKSVEEEIVPLQHKIQVTPNIEVWLGELAKEMKNTLKLLLKQSLKISKVEGQGGLDPSNFPSQILCLTEQILFTEKCEKAIQNNSLHHLLDEMKAQLDSFTNTDLSESTVESYILSLKLKALILDTIHEIAIVEHLIDKKVKNLNDWYWQKQLRFYLRSDGVAIGKMVDAEFEYTYEYQGNPSKLVHTPLTDKCYLTLTQGMKMGLGGYPYGPAGTGKTESVKALGNLMGRQVLVFNCDEGIDVKSMNRIFIGLVKCGAWGCFDEFNRLEEAVLSALSVQIQSIQSALKNKVTEIELLDRKVDVNPNSGIFITLNPAGKGYGGRQKLPDNLKQLFRPVAMSVPDNELIAEVLLFSEGFKHSKILGCKLVAIFNLAKDLLSQQQHYDWGLRGLKTILQSCGKLLQTEKHKESNKKDIGSEMFETELVVQALRINTISKLSFVDAKHFDELVLDVFPNVKLKNLEYETLYKTVKEVCTEMKMMIIENQVKKVMELYEQLQQRIGVVIVGLSGSGKSTLWKLLKHALNKMGKNVKHYLMNPKAISRIQLLGFIDVDTREWHDGVLTTSAREVVRESQDVHSWIICDGDIDPEWIESLNSVLDDNHLLTLPSGERIQFGQNVNFLFETDDLNNASPATISRMGIIFLSEQDTDIQALVTSWIQQQPNEYQTFLENMINQYFFKSLDWIIKQNDFIIETSVIGLAMNGLSHLANILSKPKFALSLIRGLGSNLSKENHEIFAKQIFSWMEISIPNPNKVLNTYYNERDDHLDYYISELNNDITIEKFCNGNPPVIVTTDVQQIAGIILPWLQPKIFQSVLLIGPEGSGKSMILQHCFQQLHSVQIATVHCTAQTTPYHLLQKILPLCLIVNSHSGRTLRPKESEKLILHLKDINLPKPDKWGTCQLISWLQQVLTYQGFYDDHLEWITLDGIQIISSFSSGTSLGKHSLSSRFTSLVRICAVSYPDDEQLKLIYTSYLKPILLYNFKDNSVWTSFNNIQQLAGSMVDILKQVKSRFHSDENNHYQFTPKCLTELVISLLRYDFNMFKSNNSSEELLHIWAYEVSRIFRDCLIDNESREKFDNILSNLIRADWGINVMDQINDWYYVTYDNSIPSSSFGKILKKMSVENWQALVQKSVHLFNHEVQEINIVIFQEVLNYLARIDRVLTKPRGSLLLAGVSGVGRRLATRIVSHMHQIAYFTPKIHRNYSITHFKNDLKSLMQSSAIENQQTVLLIEDYQLLKSEFLEMINSLLASGEIPGLYNSEEFESLMNPLRNQASEEGWRGSLLDYCSFKVKKNLHIVLVMDFTSSDFHLHCEGNPSLYKCCSVQWMDEWCEESMKKIPYELLAKDSDKYKIGDDDKSFIDEEFLDNFVKLHKLCEKSIATPRRYMTFVQNFFAVFQSKKLLITKRKDHLQAGVSKLNEARLLVDNLKSKAAEQSKLLAEKQAEADDALKQITSSMSSTSDQKTEMENLKSKIEEENKKIAKRKKEIEKEMAEIEPIVQEAKAAVGNIRSEALSEIRSLRAPPDIIRDILEGVLRLMGIFDTSWVSMKSFLSKRGVKEEIISFDARKITPEIRYSVDQLLSKNHESFDPKNAKRASAAAAPLASWVKANVKYSQVLEKVSPLEKEQAKLQHNLVSAERRINKLSGALEDVEQEVIHLRDKLSKFTKEAAEIEFNLKHSKEIIISAETLVQQLDSEYQRWTKQLGEIDKELTKLPVQSLLAAAFITYLSSSSEDIRQINIEKWCSILGYKSFDLKQFLSNEQEQLTWKTEGLPSDLLSIENAIIILQLSKLEIGSTLYPFLIDPSTRATNWLKFHLRNTNIDIVSQQDNNFPTSLELAVRFGKTLIVLDVDTIEPLLYSLLRADLISQGPRYVIQIGEKLVDFNENFKMFLITKYSSLELPPYASALITTVNFSTTKAGLMGQLLAAVLQHEKPELEQRRMQLLEQEEELKLQLTKLEESLLEQLASAQGNILENKELIASLNNTKSSSLNISSALKESQQLQLSLEEERKVYLPLAQFGSNLYFVITELIKLNNMYDFSLSTFFKLFNQALATDKISNSPEDRMKGLIQSLQHLVYEYVCRSLFKTDRLTFAMHLIHGMYTQHFQENEWEAFIGMLITDVKLDKNEMKSLLPDWVEEERALAVTLLKNTFPNLFSSLRINDNNLWNTFAKSYHCEQEIPSIVEQQLTSFQQVLLIQALRPDRLQSAMTTFCSRLLTLKELSPPALNLRNIYSYETLASEPILIIISPGADPSQELQELSAEIVGSEKYYQVSMGQGQMEIAIDYLHNCAQEGNWLCLKNLHLVTHWLPTLIKEFNKLSPHENFRLWLTSEPHPKFSPILLQMSLKLTYEAPPGVKKNLLRTYNSWSQEYVNSGKNMTRSHILFILAWFHAILQERRMYIPQGWTKFYEFNLADLRAGADIIDRIYKNPGSIKINQLEYIHGLYESAIYGGRIDNPFDMRILISYLRQFFNDQVISGSVSMRKHFSCNIQLPNSADYQEYVRAIYQMPEEDSPQYFGLPANIERSIQRISSNQVIQQLKLLMRPSEVENTFDINRWNTELSPILNLWKKLNQGAQLIQLNVKPPTEHDGKYSPLNSFVQLEYYNGIQLVQFIHASLAGLSKVIRGTLLLTKEIQQLAASLLCHETPSSWQKKWDGPEDPLHYLRGVMSRALAIQKWLKLAETGSLINETLDLSELFHPDTFLNAFRQETAREIKQSMDYLKFVSNWNGPVSGSKMCLKITGLQLVGCLFDGIHLTDCKRDSPSITAVPPCFVAWIPKDFSPYQETVISLPVYFTQERERIVTCLDVPCGNSKDHWLQCGAAFLLKSS